MRCWRQLIPILGLSLLVTGCAGRYTITTASGRMITSKGKPAYDKENSVFRYKDANGMRRTIPAGSVRNIAPASATAK